MTPNDIYVKCCNGDALTDAELEFGSGFYSKLADNLSQCGETFRLAANEALRVARALSSYQAARKS